MLNYEICCFTTKICFLFFKNKIFLWFYKKSFIFLLLSGSVSSDRAGVCPSSTTDSQTSSRSFSRSSQTNQRFPLSFSSFHFFILSSVFLLHQNLLFVGSWVWHEDRGRAKRPSWKSRDAIISEDQRLELFDLQPEPSAHVRPPRSAVMAHHQWRWNAFSTDKKNKSFQPIKHLKPSKCCPPEMWHKQEIKHVTLQRFRQQIVVKIKKEKLKFSKIGLF